MLLLMLLGIVLRCLTAAGLERVKQSMAVAPHSSDNPILKGALQPRQEVCLVTAAAAGHVLLVPGLVAGQLLLPFSVLPLSLALCCSCWRRAACTTFCCLKQLTHMLVLYLIFLWPFVIAGRWQLPWPGCALLWGKVPLPQLL
jgi:hypothetical protein